MDLEKVKQIAESHYVFNDNPLLVVDLKAIRDNYLDFKSYFPSVDVHFAVKSLTDKSVVTTLAKEGCSFEAASLSELQFLGKLLTDKQLKNVYYSNPAKSKRSIVVAMIAGIRWFCIDSSEEARKICEMANFLRIPLSELRVYLRIQAQSSDCVWPLSKKFGAPIEKAAEIIYDAISIGIKLAGFTFHVGSQCVDSDAWSRSILDVDFLIGHASSIDAVTEKVTVNMGGGFPSTVTSHNASLQRISDSVINAVSRCVHWERISLAAEPGRFISSNAGMLCSRIVLRTKKDGENWLYLDAGVFHGMIEPSQGVMGNVSTSFDGLEKEEFILAGPSCDSADVIPVKVMLPKDVREDDIIFVENSGAYSMAYATGNADAGIPGFNGFLPPTVYYIHK